MCSNITNILHIPTILYGKVNARSIVLDGIYSGGVILNEISAWILCMVHVNVVWGYYGSWISCILMN